MHAGIRVPARAPSQALAPIPMPTQARGPARQAPAAPLPLHDISRVPVAGPIQRRAAPGAADRTGLPQGLKAGLESMSGLSMDAVRVHYRSPEPARIAAHAFARGTDIHLAPGQERHLPHEAWHVVQQAQGRVRPTVDMAGTAVNDDVGLEREADRMGDASLTRGRSPAAHAVAPGQVAAPAGDTVQGEFTIGAGALKGTYKTKAGRDTNWLVDEVKRAIEDELGSGWIGDLRGWAAKGEGPYSWNSTTEFLDYMLENYAKVQKDGKTRPNFSSIAYKLAKITYGIQTGMDQSGLSPSDDDLAMPHRFPYAGIELSTALFISGKENDSDLKRWTDRLYNATVERRKLNLPHIATKAESQWYNKAVQDQLDELKNAVSAIISAKKKGEAMTLHTPVVQRLLKAANNMHGNIPDYGPHSKINIPVSNRLHLHAEAPDEDMQEDDDWTVPLTPGSYEAGQMSPHRIPKGIAHDDDGEYMIGTDGYGYPTERIEGYDDLMKRHKVGNTTINAFDQWS